jgi:hypothetical protein
MIKEQFNALSALSELFVSNKWVELENGTLSLIDKANENKIIGLYGFVMHITTTYLGLIALKKNEIELAKEHLINSLLVPTSPYLKSAGPNMLVAKKLLALGETDVVSDYIKLCEANWGFPLRIFYIGKWKRALKKGKTPDFKHYTDIHIKHFQKLPD